MKNEELARLFYRSLDKIIESNTADFYQTLKQKTDENTHTQYPAEISIQIQEFYQLLIKIAFEVTREEGIYFNTLFTRFAFVGQKFQLPSGRMFFLHEFRRKAANLPLLPDHELPMIWQLGIRVVADFTKSVFGAPIPDLLQKRLPKGNFYQQRPVEITEKMDSLRVLAVADDVKNKWFLANPEHDPSQIIHIQYDISDRNENFRASVEAIQRVFGFPITLQLLDVERDTDGIFRPRAFVIEPDYLLDVTTISDCFRESGAEPALALLRKFLPKDDTPAIMTGNIANFFLDELIANPKADYRETFAKTFKLNPLAFCRYSEEQVKTIYTNAKRHFSSIQKMVGGEFQKNGIAPDNVFLEPSFLSETHGLQGRLDVFFKNPMSNVAAIVELKSGKPFRANMYGLSPNHFIQTLLYDLLIKHAFSDKLQTTNYILYSALDDLNLKYAPPVKSQQWEAINVRNQILAIEQSLINVNKEKFSEQNAFSHMIRVLSKSATGFERRDLENFEKTWDEMTDLERRYFVKFAAFVAREHQLAKVGVEGAEINGMAALWRDSQSIKEENFEIMAFMTILENKSNELDAFIWLEKSEWTQALANFRVGDIVVMYPTHEKWVNNLQKNAEKSEDTGGGHISPTKNQIFKASILELSGQSVKIRLRSHQLNQILFETTPFWNLEHDFMDSSFNAQYRGLFELMRSSSEKRNLLLCTRPPSKPTNLGTINFKNQEKLTPEQYKILKKIIKSKDYFLLWGPPGTGKTSVMLQYLVEWLLENTTENILLLAYTNRAVDEICESIEQSGAWIRDAYVRVGSRFATDARFTNQLLDVKIKDVTTRKDLKSVIENHRIFVGTVASIAGKADLLKLKKFHRAIIDEASQILEPSLVGLLPHFDHFTLIGDHRQLPAVVSQSPKESATNDELLESIGLSNLRNSFFERLYKNAQQNGWSHAFDILTKQGRMHRDVMAFPSRFFYDNQLDILPQNVRQMADISPENLKNVESFIQKIRAHRVIFVNTKPDRFSISGKTNRFEAAAMVKLIEIFEPICENIGIITPFRAQIAQIRQTLTDHDRDPDALTIDTVERYQGGARDVVFISLCTNRASLLNAAASLSDEGIDRKLNVALTRARSHVVLVGNADILRESPTYKKLLDFIESDENAFAAHFDAETEG